MLKRFAHSQWLLTGLAVLFALLAVAAFFTDTLRSEVSGSLIPMHKAGVGMLTPDAPVSQTFKAESRGLYAVDVMVSTYNKKLHEGTLSLWLTDSRGNEIARMTRPVEGLKNNAFVTLELPEALSSSKGQTYTLYATSDCVEEKGVTLRMGPLDNAGDKELTMPDGAHDTDSALNLRMHYELPIYGTMGASTLALIAIYFAACIPLAKRKEQAYE